MANGLFGLGGCQAPVAAANACAPAAPVGGLFSNCGFLLLLLLFVLLAAGPCFGMDGRFFFIIILAIIAFGGFGRTFGFGI